MRSGIRIGRIFGIQIVLDLSWVVIFLLVCWNLTAVFSSWHPAWAFGESVSLAVAAAVLFFCSVLAHELAHSLVARSFGVEVREIRLFLFGGVSNIAHEPPSAKAELLIAVVGPLTSIAFGVAMSMVGSFFVPAGLVRSGDMFHSLAGMGPLTTLLLWLGSINVIVGVFNLIPGFPLDGGRILRALIWAGTRDLRKATLWASTVGQIVGWVFVAVGVGMFFGMSVPFFGHGLVSGLWLVFIGWFLASAANASYRSMWVHEALEGIRVVNLMRRAAPAIPLEASVDDVVRQWFMRSPEHAFPVVDGNGGLAGLVCPSDVRRVSDDRWTTTRVSDVMTPLARLAVATPSQDAQDALAELAQRDVEQLPVVHAGTRELVGMLSRRDVARWLELRSGSQLHHRHFGPRAA
ncbi:MAG TPA: site-2 protease family protein [Polyangiaceae bacterium]|jgi:Zn-dependent protease